ncbi:hypothetical protein [Lentzea albida]|uniref:Ribosomal protein L7/L12 C-terminal domain-containing protein n=1 Tax=Lentzea albida TaxID=65499 RepID=A0A1H9T118_9PSEU|nr:hypothetical protein [Lentzea albida]SER90333.1 hypothetical protein SAMN04488000_11354 [Lentzea albida]
MTEHRPAAREFVDGLPAERAGVELACPDCGEASTSGEPCSWCRILRTWRALPQSVRDELRPAMEARQTTVAVIEQIRTALGCGLKEAVEFVHLPHYRDLD